MKDILNYRVKHREPFRPFAPAVLAEAAGGILGAGLALAALERASRKWGTLDLM